MNYKVSKNKIPWYVSAQRVNLLALTPDQRRERSDFLWRNGKAVEVFPDGTTNHPNSPYNKPGGAELAKATMEKILKETAEENAQRKAAGVAPIKDPFAPAGPTQRTKAPNSNAGTKGSESQSPRAPVNNSNKPMTAADIPVDGVVNYKTGKRAKNLQDVIAIAQSGDAGGRNYIANALTEEQKALVPKDLYNKIIDQFKPKAINKPEEPRYDPKKDERIKQYQANENRRKAIEEANRQAASNLSKNTALPSETNRLQSNKPIANLLPATPLAQAPPNTNKLFQAPTSGGRPVGNASPNPVQSNKNSQSIDGKGMVDVSTGKVNWGPGWDPSSQKATPIPPEKRQPQTNLSPAQDPSRLGFSNYTPQPSQQAQQQRVFDAAKSGDTQARNDLYHSNRDLWKQLPPSSVTNPGQYGDSPRDLVNKILSDPAQAKQARNELANRAAWGDPQSQQMLAALPQIMKNQSDALYADYRKDLKVDYRNSSEPFRPLTPQQLADEKAMFQTLGATEKEKRGLMPSRSKNDNDPMAPLFPKTAAPQQSSSGFVTVNGEVRNYGAANSAGSQKPKKETGYATFMGQKVPAGKYSFK